MCELLINGTTDLARGALCVSARKCDNVRGRELEVENWHCWMYSLDSCQERNCLLQVSLSQLELAREQTTSFTRFNLPRAANNWQKKVLKEAKLRLLYIKKFLKTTQLWVEGKIYIFIIIVVEERRSRFAQINPIYFHMSFLWQTLAASFTWQTFHHQFSMGRLAGRPLLFREMKISLS